MQLTALVRQLRSTGLARWAKWTSVPLVSGLLLAAGIQVVFAQTGLTATAVGPTQVNLSWPAFGNSPGAVDLRRCEGAGCSLGNNAIIVEGPVTNGAAPGLPNPGSYVDTGLKPGTTYSYQVTANGAGFLQATVTTPGGLFATAVSGTQINLIWSKVGTDATVTLRRCAGAGCSTGPGTEIAVDLANPGSYQDTGLTPGTSYSYQVTTCCSGFYNATAKTPDTIAPTITSSQNPAANAAGWNNSDVTVSFTCTDNGVIASCTGPIPVSAEGSSTVSGTACDAAGNCASTSRTVKIDKTKPTITSSQNVPANGDGWNKTDVTVSFTCADSGGSGIASCTDASMVSAEGSTTVNGTACDAAGNCVSTSRTIKIDKTAPTISSGQDPVANAAGWNNSDVTVSFTCADNVGGSGIASCTDPTPVGAEGSTTVNGTACDVAGNCTSGNRTVKIDKTAPTITITGVQDGADYTLGAVVPTAGCSATDAVSGLPSGPSCTITQMASPSTATGAGTYTWLATSTDLAGNTAEKTVSYRVVYVFGGFRQPVVAPVQTFKLGSTIPVKIQLFDAAGASVATAVVHFDAVKDTDNVPDVDPTEGADVVPDGNDTFRYADSQYIFNWGTKGAPSVGGYAIFATPDDGTRHGIFIHLK